MRLVVSYLLNHHNICNIQLYLKIQFLIHLYKMFSRICLNNKIRKKNKFNLKNRYNSLNLESKRYNKRIYCKSNNNYIGNKWKILIILRICYNNLMMMTNKSMKLMKIDKFNRVWFLNSCLKIVVVVPWYLILK